MTHSLSITAVDPCGKGGHTGIVHCTLDDSGIHLVKSYALTFDETIEWLCEGGPTTDTLICEQFVPRNIDGADYTPLKVEGAILLWHKTHPDTKLVWQIPSARSFIGDGPLRNTGLHFPGSKDHHNDRREAARHLLAYAVATISHKPTILLAYPHLNR